MVAQFTRSSAPEGIVNSEELEKDEGVEGVEGVEGFGGGHPLPP
jgi:hypothetical protein